MPTIISRILSVIPLEVFVLLGSFIEEILAPIPSPLIMTSAGLVADQNNYQWFGILFLAIVGAIGKTAASWIIYVISEKGEDVIFEKYGKYLGVSHQQVENVGQLFSKGWWDEIVIFVLRAIPVVPSFLVSVIAGVIKLDLRSFLVATFLGTIVRNILYLAVGMYGLQTLDHLLGLLEHGSTDIIILIGLGLLGYVALSKLRHSLVKKATHHEKK
jgi:membrane protein DedA with SNARE-associated domain